MVFAVRAHGLLFLKNKNGGTSLLSSILLHRPLYWASLGSMLTICSALLTRLIQLALEDIKSISTLFATAALLLAWTCAIVLNYIESQISTRSSTWIYGFYAISIVAAAINLRTMNDTHLNGQPQFISFCVYLTALCVGFILENWPRSTSTSSNTTLYTDANAEEKEWEKPTAYDQANLLSRLCFAFLDPIIMKGFGRPLVDDDIANMMPRRIRTVYSYTLISAVWDRHLQKRHNASSKKTPSLLWVIFRASGWAWLSVVGLALLESILVFIQPILLDIILDFVASYSTDQSQPTSLGVILAVGMFAAAILASITNGQYFQQSTNLGIELKSGLISVIYRKSLKLSPDARRGATVGEIMNHMSVDAERVAQSVTYLPLIISSPFEIAVATWLLYRQMGPSGLTGLGVVVLTMPAQWLIAKVLNRAKDKKLSTMDERVRLLSDILSGIKAVKLYSWEKSFTLRLKAFRRVELKYLMQIGIATAFMMIMYSSLPSLMALLSFVVYAMAGGPNGSQGVMSARVVFVSITLFNRLSMPIGRASQIIGQAISLNVAVKRIQTFLLQEEMDENQVEFNVRPPPGPCNESPALVSNSGAATNQSGYNQPLAINVADGTFNWTNLSVATNSKERSPTDKGQQRATLCDINLEVPYGYLTAIMGRVGQGKSSLLSAIIGEMYKEKGTVKLNGRVAYVAQEAWIMNCSVKDNILFGKPLDQERYEQVLRACSLTQDLEMLPAGDQTEIGERGINLSGGQKQRVSLARSAYQDADIYLMDDPLSAVDAHVDQHLWNNLIGPNGLLKDKTRLLVTHGIHHLPEMDHIVVIKDGLIVEQGQYADLMTSGALFAQLINEYSHKGNEPESPTASAAAGAVTIESEDMASKGYSRTQDIFNAEELQGHRGDKEADTDARTTVLAQEASTTAIKGDDNAELIMEEEAAQGSVGWSVFMRYCKAASYILSVLSALGFVGSQASQISISIWLKEWAGQEGRGEQSSVPKFLGVYAAFVALYILFDLGANVIILALGGVRATRVLHDNLLDNVMRLPMSFFDTTPVGRIVNRFSSDVDNVDELIPIAISDVYYFSTTVLGTLIVISISLPIFLALVPLLIGLYLIFQILFIRSSRQLKRIHSISKSPLYQHFGETLAGISTIRAMRVHERFIQENAMKSDRSSNANFVYTIVIRWLHIRLEFLGALIIFATALLAVLGKRTLGAEIAGLALSYALNTTFAITWMMKALSELQNQLVSVERIHEYSVKNQEAPASLPTDANLPSNWPSEGRIEFKNYSTRYRQGLDLVVKGVSFEVSPAERIGIVGRTGAGKSSLTLALFRIIEAANSHWAKASHNGPDTRLLEIESSAMPKVPSDSREDDVEEAKLETMQVEEDGGSIEIDGVDISTVGLHQLRQHLAIIPQDPTLFSGTVRENLDPFHQATDAEIWEALDRAHLKDHISSLTNGLSFEVAQNGENFSVGQRSLLCLARALLRKTKVLVLDEATAAVDVETDELIQKTIRKEFQDRTILTIAHRIKTIMDYDKILVLEKGQVEEYDTPANLLRKKGLFYSLAKQAGQAT
ncbi:Multidrug resistance-associated protein 1 [Lobosporangium transversale]|uniref:P-loop containing nucleoside triphosphate hydrolase protein n=1 Tax=Lobosporangium transversale TaxID=64571 RepID=A0A1Y2GV00_9FUNG|nr:hypothetical protein BCR41DRAFT_368699 [Lobosporangium transversale]KAF9918677.1 Multidrug resistance-associated protein 1 [Lobosporangium transversale]ORZ24881.1 hypothetical protein BCR41DRAFT_368699 [Lobosporangium transversale]|eukprot:XP_021883862.1 hypothetical protein BCR41DRAFT_368699 [Lobosporangium transversale]